MKIFKLTMFIIGAVVGAGFASGKEIFEYFAKYGIYSFLFLIPLFFILYFLIYLALSFGKMYSEFDLKDCNKFLASDVNIFKTKFNPLNAMLFVTFLIHCSAMFSGLIALFETYLKFSCRPLYFLLALIITALLSKMSLKFFSNVSALVVPFIIVCILFNCVCSLSSGSFASSFGITNLTPLIFLTVSYACQNVFFSSFIIMKLGRDLTFKEMKKVSLLVSFFISLLLALGILCFLFNPTLAYSEMPFAEVAIAINPVFSIVFGAILLFSILTTHATSIASLKEYFSGDKKFNTNFVMIMLIAILSLFNFGKIIQYFYPIVGVFGAIYFYKIFKLLFNKNPLFKREKTNLKRKNIN